MRGQELRKLFQVPDNSVLKDKKFRNHFEHFDERLDKWSRSQQSSQWSLMDGWISYGGVRFSGKPETLLRIFHADCLTLTFYDEQYDLGAVIAAIGELQDKVHRKAYELKNERDAKRSEE